MSPDLFKDTLMAANECTLAGVKAGQEAARRECAKEIANLKAALESALEFIEGYEDVVDGDYGEPKPNRAMSVANEIRWALGLVP